MNEIREETLLGRKITAIKTLSAIYRRGIEGGEGCGRRDGEELREELPEKIRGG